MSGEFDDDIRAEMAAAKKSKPKAKSTAPKQSFEDSTPPPNPQAEALNKQLQDLMDGQGVPGGLLKYQLEAWRNGHGSGHMNDEYVGPKFQTDPSEDYGRKDPGLEEMMNVLMSQSDNAPWYSHMQDI